MYKNKVSKGKEKKRKDTKSPHYIPQKENTPPNKKISYINSPPKNMTTLIPKTTSPFCHEWQKASNSSIHLVVTERASIRIFMLIIIEVTIIILVLKCLWRRRGRCHKATKASLSSCNTTDISVHLTQLITKCVKASIHALKLHHDRLESHTRRRRRSGWRWSRRCRRSHHLSSWPLWSKLGLVPSNSRCVYSTHNREVCRLKIGDRKMAKNSYDNRKKNELITGRHIPIDIYRESKKWEGKSIVSPSRKDSKNGARGSVIEL